MHDAPIVHRPTVADTALAHLALKDADRCPRVAEITEADIRWGTSRAPLPRRERIPTRLIEHLSPAALLALAEDLQDDVATLRVVVRELCAALERVTTDRDRLRRAVQGRRP